MNYIKQALKFLKLHEGYRQFPYECSVGVQTIGYGRNLESVGLSETEAEYLLQQDILEAEKHCKKYGYYLTLSGERKAVLIDMMVNMGPSRLSTFKNMHQALYMQDYDVAALEMLDSKWAKQVGQRAFTLSSVMHSNKI